jgi:trimethylamine:corrinoid methyltransferase-like protein
MLLAEYASKPGPAFAWNVRQVDYLVEMGEIMGIDEWFTWGASCFAHPLRFDKDVADKFARSVRSGMAAGFAGDEVTVAAGLTGMQISGFTTPVTVAGYVVVSGAEFVGTWIAARALNPAVPLTGSVWGGSMDMRTGGVSYSSPDGMVRACATSEFLRRWCGIEVAVGGGEYCDARAPGLYAAMEKAYKAMTIAAFTGRHPAIGQGMLESGRTISPVQLLIDRELGRGVQILGRPIDVSDEMMALDTILEVGNALDKSYLHTAHTSRNYRRHTWMPDLIDRAGWNGAESDAALVAAARRKVDELIASYHKPAVDTDKLRRMRAVVERARRELVERDRHAPDGG